MLKPCNEYCEKRTPSVHDIATPTYRRSYRPSTYITTVPEGVHNNHKISFRLRNQQSNMHILTAIEWSRCSATYRSQRALSIKFIVSIFLKHSRCFNDVDISTG